MPPARRPPGCPVASVAVASPPTASSPPPAGRPQSRDRTGGVTRVTPAVPPWGAGRGHPPSPLLVLLVARHRPPLRPHRRCLSPREAEGCPQPHCCPLPAPRGSSEGMDSGSSHPPRAPQAGGRGLGGLEEGTPRVGTPLRHALRCFGTREVIKCPQTRVLWSRSVCQGPRYGDGMGFRDSQGCAMGQPVTM